MLIADAQVHLWHTRRQLGVMAAHRQVDAFTTDALLLEMERAGVDRALIVPVGWEANDYALTAAQVHPERFAVLGKLPGRAPLTSSELTGWRPPGLLGLRLNFHAAESRAQFESGDIDWLWSAAERSNFQIGSMLVPAEMLPAIGRIAALHPGLRLTIGHMGTPRTTNYARDEAAFAHLPQLLELARYPNVAVAATGAPSCASGPYPFTSIDTFLHRIFDVFGPQRMFWGSDLTRMPCPYRQCVTHFTEEIRWLSGADLELVMGHALCDWLAWNTTQSKASK